MKIKLVLILSIVLPSIQGYSQQSNELSIYYGLVESQLLRTTALAGGGAYENNNTHELGLQYLRKISNRLSVESGLNLLRTSVEITPAFTGVELPSRDENLLLISIPVYANYGFKKYLFVNAGPILSFQSKQSSFDSQSGLGFGMGVGFKYPYNSFLFYINPMLKIHSIIPFEKENYHQRLTQLGMQLGVGYEF